MGAGVTGAGAGFKATGTGAGVDAIGAGGGVGATGFTVSGVFGGAGCSHAGIGASGVGSGEVGRLGVGRSGDFGGVAVTGGVTGVGAVAITGLGAGGVGAGAGVGVGATGVAAGAGVVPLLGCSHAGSGPSGPETGACGFGASFAAGAAGGVGAGAGAVGAGFGEGAGAGAGATGFGAGAGAGAGSAFFGVGLSQSGMEVSERTGAGDNAGATVSFAGVGAGRGAGFLGASSTISGRLIGAISVPAPSLPMVIFLSASSRRSARDLPCRSFRNANVAAPPMAAATTRNRRSLMTSLMILDVLPGSGLGSSSRGVSGSVGAASELPRTRIDCCRSRMSIPLRRSLSRTRTT